MSKTGGDHGARAEKCLKLAGIMARVLVLVLVRVLVLVLPPRGGRGGRGGRGNLLTFVDPNPAQRGN